MTQVAAASEMQLNEDNAVKPEMAVFQQLNLNENNILFFFFVKTFFVQKNVFGWWER